MLILPEWVRHSYAVGKSVNTREGSIQLPLTKIPVDHFIIDELHVLCRIFDVMVDNLIALAVLMDKQARDGSQHHINGLAVAIRECDVTFHIWKDLEKDGKYKCTSLTGGGRKKVIKVMYKDMALVHCYMYMYASACMHTQMLPSKLEVVLPHTTTEATVMLWKVHACTSNAAAIIQCAIQWPGLSTAVLSDFVSGAWTSQCYT